MNAVGPRLTPKVERLSLGAISRTLVVTPGMCGGSSLFMTQLGDWTWETVSALCDMNVFDARDARGAPTYLAFYYFHIKASPRNHLGTLSFGDPIDVISCSFNCGSESILTLHRVRAASSESEVHPFTLHEFYDAPEPDGVYIATFNRWIGRSRPDSNAELGSRSPKDFRYAHLPALPTRYSPRRDYGPARRNLMFDVGAVEDPVHRVRSLRIEYVVDVSRDMNGVGLVHFAAYFAIVDRGLLAMWRELGRSDCDFLHRAVVDQKLCYVANADPGSTLSVRVTLWRPKNDETHEVFNVVLEECGTTRLIAISTLVLARGLSTPGVL